MSKGLTSKKFRPIVEGLDNTIKKGFQKLANTNIVIVYVLYVCKTQLSYVTDSLFF